MQVIERNTPEYRRFMADAIAGNQLHILQQLKEAQAMRIQKIRLVGGFYDDLRCTLTTETEEEQEARQQQEYKLITNQEYYNTLTNL